MGTVSRTIKRLDDLDRRVLGRYYPMPGPPLVLRWGGRSWQPPRWLGVLLYLAALLAVGILRGALPHWAGRPLQILIILMVIPLAWNFAPVLFVRGFRSGLRGEKTPPVS